MNPLSGDLVPGEAHSTRELPRKGCTHAEAVAQEYRYHARRPRRGDTALRGVASAQPDLGAIINTTCTYDQVIAALDDQHPDLAVQFAQQRGGQQAVRSFLASSPQQRQATVAFLQGNPTAQAYFVPILDVANSCNNYNS